MQLFTYNEYTKAFRQTLSDDMSLFSLKKKKEKRLNSSHVAIATQACASYRLWYLCVEIFCTDI